MGRRPDRLHTQWLLVGAVDLDTLLLGLHSPAPPRRRSCTCPASSRTRTGLTTWPLWMWTLRAPPTPRLSPVFTSPILGTRFITPGGMPAALAGMTPTGPVAG